MSLVPAVGSETHFSVVGSQVYPIPHTSGEAEQSPPFPTHAMQVVVSEVQTLPSTHCSLTVGSHVDPMASALLQVPGAPPDVSHQSPSWQGHLPPTADGVKQVKLVLSHTRPDAHAALVQDCPAVAKARQVPGHVEAVELQDPLAQSMDP